MKPTKTLVLLADDRRARLFTSAGTGEELIEIEDLSAEVLSGANVRFADRPGRDRAAPGMALHGFDRTETEHDQSRAGFAKAILAEAEGRFADGGYGRFVMAAAPGMLGVLRDGLPKALKEALVADLAKDLLYLEPAEVVEHLAEKVAL